jgi:hypothetical protein
MPVSGVLISRSLTDLPAEVRVQIYQHLFDGAELSVEPAFPAVSHCNRSFCVCRFPHALLSTCRLLRLEATSYLLKSTTLHLSSTSHKVRLLPPSFIAGISRAVIMNIGHYLREPLDFTKFQALRVLELRNIAVWCRYHEDDDFEGEAGHELMMNLATFNIKRNSASLAALCACVERPFKIILCCRFVISSFRQRQETLVSTLSWRKLPD